MLGYLLSVYQYLAFLKIGQSSNELFGHTSNLASGVASSISEGEIFIYSCSGQLSSFEIDLISKEFNCAEHEYMNMSPPFIELATPLNLACSKLF